MTTRCTLCGADGHAAKDCPWRTCPGCGGLKVLKDPRDGSWRDCGCCPPISSLQPTPAAEGAKVAEPEWISWQGGSCPVDGSTYVEIKMRDGDIATYLGRLVGWSVTTRGSDVVAYRVVPTPDFSGSRPDPAPGVLKHAQPADISDGAADILIKLAKLSDCHPDGSRREKLRELVRMAAFEGQARAVLAQPSGGDERAGFEAAILKIAARNEYRHMDNLLKRPADSGDYSTTWVDSAWIGWQARAALSQQQGREADDAKRYRWLRDASMSERNRLEHYASHAMDTAIDAAIAAAKEN